MADIESLRRLHYNATVVRTRRVHEDLLVLRVLADAGPVRFVPGQYTSLGLGDWEPCVNDTEHLGESAQPKPELIRRAYSFSAAMIDDEGCLLPPNADTANEFYIALVHTATATRPMLTPRLFALGKGARLHIGLRPHGRYTTAGVAPDDTLLFVATGTGEAPHNTIVADLLASGHRGRIVSVTCVRCRSDLAYFAAHMSLQAAFANYQYIWLTTRERENLDPDAPNYVGKRYLQDYFSEGGLSSDTGLALRPEKMHVYLCGNPAMIGRRPPLVATTGHPKGMVEVLLSHGFTFDRGHGQGSIHVETFC